MNSSYPVFCGISLNFKPKIVKRIAPYLLIPTLIGIVLGCGEEVLKEDERSLAPALRTQPVAEFYENGSLKVEGFENNKKEREGTWKYYFPDGILWSLGDYRNGRRHGRTIVYYSNGNLRYSGQYSDDVKTGEWAFYDTTGKKVEVKRY
jgi:hypothetical protein